MDNTGRAAQPSPGSGQVIGEYGMWSDAGVRRLATVALSDVRFIKGPLGYSVFWNGIVLGRINHHKRQKTFTVKIEGHEFWSPPSKMLPKWHYAPSSPVDSARLAKGLALKVIADAFALAKVGTE